MEWEAFWNVAQSFADFIKGVFFDAGFAALVLIFLVVQM